MGLFDTFLARLECPVSGKTKTREIQTKDFYNTLSTYGVGDVVEGAPIDEYWLKEEWLCGDCKKIKKDKTYYQHTAYLHFYDGLFLGVYDEKGYKKRKKESLDTYEIMRLFRKAAMRATERKFLISRIYHKTRGARELIEEERKEKSGKKKGKKSGLEKVFGSYYPDSYKKLADEIIKTIEHYSKEKQVDPPWP